MKLGKEKIKFEFFKGEIKVFDLFCREDISQDKAVRDLVNIQRNMDACSGP